MYQAFTVLIFSVVISLMVVAILNGKTTMSRLVKSMLLVTVATVLPIISAFTELTLAKLIFYKELLWLASSSDSYDVIFVITSLPTFIMMLAFLIRTLKFVDLLAGVLFLGSAGLVVSTLAVGTSNIFITLSVFALTACFCVLILRPSQNIAKVENRPVIEDNQKMRAVKLSAVN